MWRTLSLAVLAATLSACSGGGGDNGGPDSIGPINCAGLTGAIPGAVTACTSGNCTAEFINAAVDGDLGTYAILELAPNSGGSVSLHATAQDGVTYPAGTPAAVVYGIQREGTGTAGSNSTSVVLTISTYLDGVLQESGQGAGGPSAVDGFDHPARRSAIGTSLPFDAIELTYAQSNGTGTVEVQVHEFCTSTN